MKTCRKDCIHGDVCGCRSYEEQICEHFKDKSRLSPCEIGTVVYLIDKELLAADPQNCTIYEDEVYEVGRGVTSNLGERWLCLVKDTGLDFYDTDIGVTAFFNYEQAERVLTRWQNENV